MPDRPSRWQVSSSLRVADTWILYFWCTYKWNEKFACNDKQQNYFDFLVNLFIQLKWIQCHLYFLLVGSNLFLYEKVHISIKVNPVTQCVDLPLQKICCVAADLLAVVEAFPPREHYCAGSWNLTSYSASHFRQQSCSKEDRQGGKHVVNFYVSNAEI